MATTTHTPLSEGTTASPEAPGRRGKQRRFGTRRGAFTWAAVLAAGAASAVLAVVTLTGGDDTSPVTGVHTGLIEHGSIRSIEGSVEDRVGGGPAAPDPHTGPAEHGSIRSNEGSVEDGAAGGSAASGDHTGLIEHGSIPSIEGSVEDGSGC